MALGDAKGDVKIKIKQKQPVQDSAGKAKPEFCCPQRPDILLQRISITSCENAAVYFKYGKQDLPKDPTKPHRPCIVNTYLW